ncbi:MAG: M23 family metallopeptidase [Anaerolineae bacterium]|nr:M23 family metallopeptidase [Anaerolineae bacterium]
MPSFALPDATQLALTTVPTAPPVEAAPAVSDTATATATLPPSPPSHHPPLPQTQPDEHYWLRRPVAEGGVVWTNKHYPYGSTRGGQLRPHHGVEFDVPHNTEILAAASGTILVAGNDATTAYGPQNSFYGNLVIIQHDTTYKGQSVFTLYGHLSQPLVQVGQQVEAEQVIALSGATGVADGPHMHFEVRVGQNSYDATRNPLLWLWPFPDRGTVVGRVTFANGALAYETAVRVERVDAPSRYAATTTYAQDTLNADELWDENFAIDDVEAGYYKVIVTVGQKIHAGTMGLSAYHLVCRDCY